MNVRYLSYAAERTVIAEPCTNNICRENLQRYAQCKVAEGLEAYLGEYLQYAWPALQAPKVQEQKVIYKVC